MWLIRLSFVSLLLLSFTFKLFCQIDEYFISGVGDFVKSSTPFLKGFVFSTPKKLYYIDSESKKLVEIKSIENKLGAGLITSLASISGSIFVGTSKGVFVLNESFSVVYEINDKSGLADLNITSLYADDKFLYIGTRFKGVYTFDHIKKVLYTTPVTVVNGIVDNFIRDLKFLSFDKVIASYDGFSEFDYLSYLYLGRSSQEYPVLSGTIGCIIPFGDNIILGTSLGLFLFDRVGEQLRRLGFNSAVFSADFIGKTLVLATYDGVVFFDLESRKYTTPDNPLLREPVASTVSISKDKIFIGFDNKKGTFALFEYRLPYLKIQKIGYPSKDKVSMLLSGSKFDLISRIDISLLSLNLGRMFYPKLEMKASKSGIELSFSVTNLVDDIYVCNVDYFYRNTKETIKDLLVVNTKAPTILFSPIPIFYNQRKMEIVGRLVSSDLESVEVTLNTRRVDVFFDKTGNRIVSSLTLLEGTNSIVFVYGNSFNNFGTNVFTVIVDTTPPEIVSPDGGRIVEREGKFLLKVIDPYIERLEFSEKVLDLRDLVTKDGREYSFSIADKSVKKIKIVAYDKAGNSSTREFEVVFVGLSGDIVMPSLPQTTKLSNIQVSFEFRGSFKRAVLYLQGIPISSIVNPSGVVSTNISLHHGKNIFRVEGFMENGQVISKSVVVEYVPEIVEMVKAVDTVTPKVGIGQEIERLKKENEELKKKVEQLEEMIRKLSEGKPVEKIVIRETKPLDAIPSLIKIQYVPNIDNFSKISKRLYGSESFSVYFYYLFRSTSISELVSERGYIIVPNKKLMDTLISTGDITTFESLSALVEWWISRELGRNESLMSIAKRLNLKVHQGRLISEKGIPITFTSGRDHLVVHLR
ncbi:MAG: hypothetical protein ABDH28_00325 [Brevinematia bacterium]